MKNLCLLILVSAVMFSAAGQDTIPKIKIEETILSPMTVLYIVDSVSASEDMSATMGKAYGEIFSVIGRQQLIPGRVMSVYHSMQLPFVFDVAVEVNKIPDQLNGRVQSKIIEGGKAVVVHMQGPYEKLIIAYRELDEWIKKNNKQIAGPPIEVYQNSPATVTDKNELLTDIYQRIK